MKLTIKLLIAFALVVATAVGVVAYLANQRTDNAFQTYVAGNGQMYVARVATSLATLYQDNGSWEGAAGLLQGLQRSSADRLVLADASGVVVADTADQLVGRSAASQADLTGSVPIVVGGQTVGQLYAPSVAAVGPGGGRGPMGAGARGTGRERRGWRDGPDGGGGLPGGGHPEPARLGTDRRGARARARRARGVAGSPATPVADSWRRPDRGR